MTMDLERLRETVDWPAMGLPNVLPDSATALEESDLERLQAARSALMSQPSHPKDAVAKLRPLFDEGKFDIRGLAVLLQAVTVDRPVFGAAAVLDQVAQLLSDDWEALGPAPEDKRRKLANMAFAATLDQIKVSITAAAQSGQIEKALDGWPDGREPGTWDLLCEAVGKAARTRALDAVLAKLPDVRAACNPLVRKPEPAADESDDTPEPTPEPKPRAPRRDSRAGGKVTLRASNHFFELLEKLRAFESLVARNECGKAAIVAQDIQQTIASFDPRLFFPELFAGFFEGLAMRAEELAAYSAQLEAPSWNALAQLYKVDLEAFLRAGGKTRVGGRASG
jgi:hypothetical protein